MVVFVLEDASEPTLGLNFKWLPVEPSCPQDGALGSGERKAFTRERQAALAVLIRVWSEGADRSDEQFWVDGRPAPRNPGLVGPSEGEDAQPHSDLWRSEPDAGRRIHGLEQISNQIGNRLVNVGDGLCGPMQYGFS